MSIFDFVDKIMHESVRACCFFWICPPLYMDVTPLASHFYNCLDYLSKKVWVGHQRKDSKGGDAQRRNFKLASWCPMCFVEEEMVDHFFVHCWWVSNVRNLSLSSMGVSWVQPPIVRNVLVA